MVSWQLLTPAEARSVIKMYTVILVQYNSSRIKTVSGSQSSVLFVNAQHNVMYSVTVYASNAEGKHGTTNTITLVESNNSTSTTKGRN